MNRLFTTDLARTLASVAGALMLSATFVTAAVGPAQSTTPTVTTASAPIA